MNFDSDLLYRDVRKKRQRLSMSQNELAKEIDVARSTFFRLSKNKEITMQTFLKLIKWTGKEATRYFNDNETTTQ